MKGMWVGYGVGCTMRLTLGHGAWQIDQPSNGSMWNSYSFQPVGQWMGYSFTDLGAEGCCRSLNALFNKIGVYRIAGARCCCHFADLWSYFKPFCVMIVTLSLFWCAYTARGTVTGTSNDLIKNALFMPRLAICSRDLHWHWINRTLLCDTMEVSMLSRAWLTIAQHVFLPALTGRPELISWKIVSGEPGTKAIAVSRFCEKLSAANWVQGVTAISRKILRSWAPKKWGPTCDHDISNSAIYTTAIYR